jgi:hypothetical protein
LHTSLTYQLQRARGGARGFGLSEEEEEKVRKDAEKERKRRREEEEREKEVRETGRDGMRQGRLSFGVGGGGSGGAVEAQQEGLPPSTEDTMMQD